MDAPWTVYLVRCRDGTLYCGVTNDLARRLAAHDAGRGARYTRGRGPVALVWREGAPDKGAALRREREVKALRREAKLALVGAGPAPGRPRAAAPPRAAPRADRKARAWSSR